MASLFKTVAAIPISQTDYEYVIPANVSEIWFQAVTANCAVAFAAGASAPYTITTTVPLVLKCGEGRKPQVLAGQKLYFTTPGTGTVSIFMVLGNTE